MMTPALGREARTKAQPPGIFRQGQQRYRRVNVA